MVVSGEFVPQQPLPKTTLEGNSADNQCQSLCCVYRRSYYTLSFSFDSLYNQLLGFESLVLILSLSVAVARVLITEMNSAHSTWLSMLALPLSTNNITNLSESAWNTVQTPVLSSRLKFWSILSSLQQYPPNLESSPARVLSDCNTNVREEKCWVEASNALLIFLLGIRLSADRPGFWRRWELRGYNIWLSWYSKWSQNYLGQLNLFLKLLPTFLFVCLSFLLTNTHTPFPKVISEVNARLSSWPSG